jgi:hypothetical protein
MTTKLPKNLGASRYAKAVSEDGTARPIATAGAAVAYTFYAAVDVVNFENTIGGLLDEGRVWLSLPMALGLSGIAIFFPHVLAYLLKDRAVKLAAARGRQSADPEVAALEQQPLDPANPFVRIASTLARWRPGRARTPDPQGVAPRWLLWGIGIAWLGAAAGTIMIRILSLGPADPASTENMAPSAIPDLGDVTISCSGFICLQFGNISNTDVATVLVFVCVMLVGAAVAFVLGWILHEAYRTQVRRAVRALTRVRRVKAAHETHAVTLREQARKLRSAAQNASEDTELKVIEDLLDASALVAKHAVRAALASGLGDPMSRSAARLSLFTESPDDLMLEGSTR